MLPLHEHVHALTEAKAEAETKLNDFIDPKAEVEKLKKEKLKIFYMDPS